MQWQSPGTRNPYAQDVLVQEATRAFMGRVYAWMFLGLGVTGAVSIAAASSEAVLTALVSGRIVIALGLLAFTWVVSGMIPRLSMGAAGALFLVYASLLGVFLSPIFVIYEVGSIGRVFFISASMFAALSVFGAVTKKDLSAWATFLFMGLYGIIAAVVVNLFWPSDGLSFVISCAGVVVFSGLTAYDTQKLRQFGAQAEAGGQRSLSIAGALHLYLDFVNLFLSLLRLLGNRR